MFSCRSNSSANRNRILSFSLLSLLIFAFAALTHPTAAGATTPTGAAWSAGSTTPALTDVVAVSSGGHHSLFVKSDTTVWAVGLDRESVVNYGQLGNGTMFTNGSSTPVQVVGFTDASAVSA